jgi:hypothetical protein
MAGRARAVRAYFTTTRVRLWRAGDSPRKPAQAPLEVAVGDAEPGAPRYAAALRALNGSLEGSFEALDVVLGDESVRYALLPSVNSRLSTPELVGLAQNVLQRTYGDAVKGWEVRLTTAGGQGLLGAAVDPMLLQAFQASAARCNARLRSVVPAFIQAFAQHRLTARENAWRVLIEPAAAVLALIAGGKIASLRVRREPITDSAVLADALHRESLRLNSEIRDVRITGERTQGLALPAGWRLTAEPLDALMSVTQPAAPRLAAQS